MFYVQPGRSLEQNQISKLFFFGNNLIKIRGFSISHNINVPSIFMNLPGEYYIHFRKISVKLETLRWVEVGYNKINTFIYLNIHFY